MYREVATHFTCIFEKPVKFSTGKWCGKCAHDFWPTPTDRLKQNIFHWYQQRNADPPTVFNLFDYLCSEKCWLCLGLKNIN